MVIKDIVDVGVGINYKWNNKVANNNRWLIIKA